MADSSAANDNLGESPAVEVTGKIMIVIIIILFFVVVIAVCLHLFSRNYWWQETAPQSQSRRRRRFAFSAGQDGALRTGLDPSVLSSIPVLLFQPKEFKDGLECAVCLSEVVEGEKTRLLPKCNHGFHVDCIDMWFQSHSTCPLCRNPVAADSDASHSSSSSNNDTQNSDSESSTFPTNVLVWGDHTQISSTGSSTLEEGPSSAAATSTCADDNNINRRHAALVIDIPSQSTSTSLSLSDDLKSPITARLRSLKRLLSRDSRLNPWSPTSVDLEQPAQGSGHT